MLDTEGGEEDIQVCPSVSSFSFSKLLLNGPVSIQQYRWRGKRPPVGYGWVQGQLGGFKVSWPFEDSESAERSLGASCHGWSLTRGGAVSLPVRGLPAW